MVCVGRRPLAQQFYISRYFMYDQDWRLIMKAGDKVILDLDYLELIKSSVSNKYYELISKTLDFIDFYPNDRSFSIILVSGVRVVVPTSCLIIYKEFSL